MKILLTGGGTGGHFYPIIAVSEAIFDLCEEEKMITPELIFMSDSVYDKNLVRDEGIVFKKVFAGKIRRYFSVLNFFDFFKTGLGILKAIWLVYSVMPDVVFGKGGYVSFPVLLAARIFGLPVLIHESDAAPGKVNKWASGFAKKIAISFEEASGYFLKEKIALTGIPIRKSLLGFTPEEGKSFFSLEEKVPVVLILGGSQGSQKINDVVAEILPDLVKNYQIIHQCGVQNEKELRERTSVILENSIFKNRYHLYSFFDALGLRDASSVADVVVSRAGATAIYEIAAWGLPAIMIPLKNSAQDHQKMNAYSYSRTGAAEVVEEDNLSPHVLSSEIKRIITDENRKKSMGEAAKKFSKPEAARKIAQEIINLALEHL